MVLLTSVSTIFTVNFLTVKKNSWQWKFPLTVKISSWQWKFPLTVKISSWQWKISIDSEKYHWQWKIPALSQLEFFTVSDIFHCQLIFFTVNWYFLLSIIFLNVRLILRYSDRKSVLLLLYSWSFHKTLTINKWVLYHKNMCIWIYKDGWIKNRQQLVRRAWWHWFSLPFP